MLSYYSMDYTVCNQGDPENPENNPDPEASPNALQDALLADSSATPPKGRSLLLPVLLPHPNAAAALWSYKRSLFRAGDEGALAFPPAIPLGALKRPLNRESLRALARAVREGSLQDGRQGRISAPYLSEEERWKTCVLPGLCLYGPELDLPPLDLQGLKEAAHIQKIILPLTIRRLDDNSALPSHSPRIAPPILENFFFTAAYVTVMKIRPLDSGVPGLSYAWHFGEVRWLPGIKGA